MFSTISLCSCFVGVRFESFVLMLCLNVDQDLVHLCKQIQVCYHFVAGPARLPPQPPRASRGLEILEFHVENETKGNERASCGGASEVVGPALTMVFYFATK